MRGFFERLAWKAERMMQGRNGQDDLARVLYWTGLILLLLSIFFNSGIVGMILNLLAFALLIYAMFRMFSKNVQKRQAENAEYLRRTEKLRTAASQYKLRFSERKQYKFAKCKCGTTLRFRRGQGTKEFTCPKCKAKMTVKT